MMDDIYFSLPLSGALKYTVSATAGMLIGVIAARSGFSSFRDVKDFLEFKNLKILRILLSAALTAIIAFPLLTEIRSFSVPQYEFFWQNLLGGIIAGIGLFISGRTLFSALAAVGCGELHALWFLLGAGGTVFAFEKWNIDIGSFIMKKDFPADNIRAVSGMDFFDFHTPGVWIAAAAAMLLVTVSVISAAQSKDKP